MFNKEAFLKKIQNIKTKPRWIFVLRFLWLLIGTLISALIVIFVLSLITFILFYSKNNLIQHQELMSFKMFFSVMPWAIIGLLTIFLIIFELFIKKLLPLYRIPLIITIGLVIAFLGISSFLINQNKSFKSMCQCQQGKFKFVDWIISSNKTKYDQIIKTGIVNKINTDMVEIKIGEELLNVNNNIFCGYCLANLKELDEVLVSGNWVSDKFIPFKVKKNVNCQGCNLKNEIKPMGSCSNM